MLARWGGEEFVILTPGSDGEMARQAAEKLAAAIRRTLFDEVGTITCSFGITQYAPGDSAPTLIARADHALYRAKMNGRNTGGTGATAGRDHHRRGVGRITLRLQPPPQADYAVTVSAISSSSSSSSTGENVLSGLVESVIGLRLL